MEGIDSKSTHNLNHGNLRKATIFLTSGSITPFKQYTTDIISKLAPTALQRRKIPIESLHFVCKIPLLARRTRPKGRPSAARDDRVSCIQHYIGYYPKWSAKGSAVVDSFYLSVS